MIRIGSDVLTLRSPALIAAAFVVTFLAGWLAFTFAASNFQGLDPVSLQTLVWPGLIGAALATLALWRGHTRGAFKTTTDVVWRCAVGIAAAGFAWPLSFGISALLQGDAQSALGAFAPAFAGMIVGAIAGALAGAVCAFALFNRA